MQQLHITFIGGGNMAEALIAGLIRSGHPADHLTVTDIRKDRLNSLNQEYGVLTDSDNIKAVNTADVVVLAVKPQQMQEVLSGLGNHLKLAATLISIAAGVGVKAIRGHLGRDDSSVVRVMPNTPALVGAGMSVLFTDSDETHRQRADYVLAASGDT
ncbi:MAG: prephenate dehydrogenase/arogenate dehydrogenase family protein, partial [Mariprofundaceae bacterium]